MLVSSSQYYSSACLWCTHRNYFSSINDLKLDVRENLFIKPSTFFVVAEEMDWDKNGMVNFKEFLFAFTRWIGIDDVEDEDED